MAPSPSVAAAEWETAQRWHATLNAQLARVHGQGTAGIKVADFAVLEDTMEKIRLCCVKIIFSDLKYAEQVRCEAVMWQSHSLVNNEYRRILSKLKASCHAVERRKIEKTYQTFLRISIAFYKGYIQRLNARYDIPELRRVAEGADLQSSDTEKRTTAASDTERRLVLESCYSTLIRTGDLARYKSQLKQKQSSFDVSMTFYSLAQDVKPDSGFAAHQMGIISIDEGNTLNMVYFFYRSLALASPHPNAMANLKTTFKSAEQAHHNDSPKAKEVPYRALSDWFVRLHALYYAGKPFAQQRELEHEVIAQLQRAAKDPKSNGILFKMSLVNMAAYHVSQVHYDAKPEQAQLYGRFVLAFSVRFLSSICDALLAALRDSTADERESQAPSLVTVLVPLLRTHCPWLAARQREILSVVKESDASLVANAMNKLAQVFTALVGEVHQVDSLGTCPYLLSEDLEMLGLQPLSKSEVPEACRTYCSENGQTKPHLGSGQKRLSATQETQSRILDILRGAYYFAENSNLPIQLSVANGEMAFVYEQRKPPMPTADHGTGSPAKSREVRTPVTPRQMPQSPTAAPLSSVGPATTSGPDIVNDLSVHDYQAQETVMDMLADFIRPPTPSKDASAETNESSYGMHTSTANELFQSYTAKEPSNETAPPSAIQSSAWQWPYMGPTPSKYHVAMARQASSRSLEASPSGRYATEAFSATAGHRSPGHVGYSPSPKTSGASSPRHLAPDSAHRQNLLQSFSSNSLVDHPRDAAEPAHGTWLVPPNSSRFSQFSHQSSLYRGTPAMYDPAQGQSRGT